MKVGVKHFLLHLVIGFLAGFALPGTHALAFGGGGIVHMEGEDHYQGAGLRESAQGVIERGAGLMVGLGIGQGLRHLVF